MCVSVLVPVGNAVAFWWGEIASFRGCVIVSELCCAHKFHVPDLTLLYKRLFPVN